MLSQIGGRTVGNRSVIWMVENNDFSYMSGQTSEPYATGREYTCAFVSLRCYIKHFPKF